MADKFRFYSVGKANEEIERLEALVQDRDKALASAQERITALESQIEAANKASPDLATLRSSLASEQASVSALGAQIKERDSTIIKLQGEITATKASTDEKAASKALNIVASQGVPPIVNPPTAKPSEDKPTGRDQKAKGWQRVAAGIRAEMHIKE